jgi:hypothetical protein
MALQERRKQMTHVIIWLSGGIIEQVTFFDSKLQALKTLADFVKNMDLHDDEAAVFSPEGLVANARNFLDENNEFIQNHGLINNLEPDEEKPNSIYIIGNPVHWLGFMVVSSDDPLGYENPIEAVSELGQMRKSAGSHLKLYQVIPLEKPIVTRTDLEQYNAENEIEDFVFSLVEEYVTN